MAHFVTTIGSPGSPEEVFEYLADFSSAAEWDPGVARAERLDEGALIEHLQAPAARGGYSIELRLDPPPGRTDSARVRECIRERVPRAESHERADVGLDPLRGHRCRQLTENRLLLRRNGHLTCRS